MPLRYAVRTRTDVPLTDQEQYLIDTQGHSIPEDKFSYEEDVPPIVAESDKENGVYAVYSANGIKLSQWQFVNQSQELEKLWRGGRAKPGPVLKDSIKQDFKQGDYLLTHKTKQTELELMQVIRNTQTKTVTENLSDTRFSSSKEAVKTRNPQAHIKIPIEMIEGGAVTPQVWEKRFALREVEHVPYVGINEEYIPVEEAQAMSDERGHFGYFNQGELVTGWVPCALSEWEEEMLHSKYHVKKKLVPSLDVPLTDALGTDILLGDWVFTNDNGQNEFWMCKVIGFTNGKVGLIGYKQFSPHMMIQAHRFFSVNWAKNIVKLPIDII